MNNDTRKPYIPSLVLTLVYGVIYYFLGELIVKNLFDAIWNPLAVAVYMVAFAVPLILILLLIARGSGKLFGEIGGYFAISAIMLVILFAVTLLLEFLYELEGVLITNKPTSYVFVIDDSSSMYSADPHNERVSAIFEIMKDEDIPYAVYRFTDEAELIRGMDVYKGDEILKFKSGGETDVLQSLNMVISDLESGRLNGGSKPRVLLLSDGDSAGSKLDEVSEKYNDLRISISAVGFGDVDDSLLVSITSGTGGVYIRSDDLRKLRNDMKKSINLVSERTLLTPRRKVRGNVLYMILRILFLTIIGVIIGLIKKNGAFGTEDTKPILLSSSVQGFIAAILCEFLVDVKAGVARMAVVILWAIMIVREEEYHNRFGSQNGNRYGDGRPNINGKGSYVGEQSRDEDTIDNGENDYGGRFSGNGGFQKGCFGEGGFNNGDNRREGEGFRDSKSHYGGFGRRGFSDGSVTYWSNQDEEGGFGKRRSKKEF